MVIPSVSCGESSFSIVIGGFGSSSSLLHSSTPGGGHQTETNLQTYNSISDDSVLAKIMYKPDEEIVPNVPVEPGLEFLGLVFRALALSWRLT